MYALVTDGAIRSTGPLPPAARRLDTGDWLSPHAGRWTDEQAAACGYLPVVRVPRPPDTETTTHDYSVELIEGTPTEVWTPRPWTQGELDAATAQTNSVEITSDLDQALIDLQVIIDSDNSVINDNPAGEIKDQARILKKIIRKINARFEETE
jgi:hypothetical protein